MASASNWQSAGALDSHLRAMHADFAEAQRYAPAILFIDEIDSIGSRDQLGGQNAVYQTEVINALLEEIQGIEATGNVIVIGATNYLDRVDPALRRAGRLDQVVEIPLPNIESLDQIYRYYLEDYRQSGGAAGRSTPGPWRSCPSGSPVRTSSSSYGVAHAGRAGSTIPWARRTWWRRSPVAHDGRTAPHASMPATCGVWRSTRPATPWPG